MNQVRERYIIVHHSVSRYESLGTTLPTSASKIRSEPSPSYMGPIDCLLLCCVCIMVSTHQHTHMLTMHLVTSYILWNITFTNLSHCCYALYAALLPFLLSLLSFLCVFFQQREPIHASGLNHIYKNRISLFSLTRPESFYTE